jgi:Leucine-rich repeat (LRR) protein
MSYIQIDIFNNSYKLTDCLNYTTTYINIDNFPEKIKNYKQLKILIFVNCKISMLPCSFSSLENLKELHLERNNFTIFPNIICSLKNLNKLIMDNNELFELPEAFSKLKNLVVLSLSHNNFKIFPLVLCKLIKLRTICMDYNFINKLPINIINLKNLVIFDLYHNFIDKMPPFIPELKNIELFKTNKDYISENFISEKTLICRLFIIFKYSLLENNCFQKFIKNKLFSLKIFYNLLLF